MPFSRSELSHSFSDRHAEGDVAVQDGDADLELGDLAVDMDVDTIVRGDSDLTRLRASHRDPCRGNVVCVWGSFGVAEMLSTWIFGKVFGRKLLSVGRRSGATKCFMLARQAAVKYGSS